MNFELEVFEDYPTFFKPLNQTQIEASAAKLKRFDQHEEKTRRTAAEKNGLESYIYKIRELVDDEGFIKFSRVEERNNATTLAEEVTS